MLVAGPGECARRMEFGDDELEHQTNVRDAGLLREASIHLADIFRQQYCESVCDEVSCLFH